MRPMINAILLLVCRHYRLEAELQSESNWRVRWDEIRFGGESGSDGRRTHPLERNGSLHARVRTVHYTIAVPLLTH